MYMSLSCSVHLEGSEDYSLIESHEAVSMIFALNTHLASLHSQVRTEVWPDRDGDAIAATVAALQPGDKVKLSWSHVYVTRTEFRDGRETSSKYPERGITLLEKL